MFYDFTKPSKVVPHYAYLAIINFPAYVPAYLAVLCHYDETNEIFSPGGLVQLSPRNNTSALQTFLLKQLRKLLGFY